MPSSNRRAFTIAGLLLIIAVLGILFFVLLPKFQKNSIDKAVGQIASHIQYIQHFSITGDEFFDASYVGLNARRTQIFFKQDHNGNWFYTLFADGVGTGNALDGIPAIGEIPKNPQNPDKLLTGDENIDGYTKEMNLGREFALTNYDAVTFVGCAKDGGKRLIFDHLGRPMEENLSAPETIYKDHYQLLTTPCTIILKNSNDDKYGITIQPILGLMSVAKL
jgi:hypothetical protein